VGYKRFGFNGKEFDWEVKGWMNQVDYGDRVYDPRAGRFLSVDPLEKDFPWYTPYQFAGNKPIWAEDLDGREESVSTTKWYFSDKGALLNTVTSDNYVQPEGTFRVGFKKQTTKEIIAEAFVKSNRLPTTGNFTFVEHQFNPGANYATYEYKDAQGNPQIAHYDAKYIDWMYDQLGIAQEKVEKGANVVGAVLNLAGAGILVKAELKGLASDIRATTNTNLALNETLAAKYTKNRPKHYQKNIEEVWEKSKDADGKVYDPNTGEELTWDKFKSRYDQWHMGHKPGHEYRTLVEKLRKGEITEEQFLKEYHNPNNYQPEGPKANMSHQFEQKKQK
jgi:RHS repeat-associated protein